MAPEPAPTLHPQDPWAAQFSHHLGRFGFPFHICLALLACMCMAGPMVGVEVGPLPLLVCWLLRIPFVWRAAWFVLRAPISILLVLLILWLCLSLLWTRDFTQGLHELANARWAWLALALWPVMNRRAWLVLALAAGLWLGHAAQVLEWLGVLTFNHPPNPGPPRFSGWWHHPVMGGALCVVSAGLASGLAAFALGRSMKWCLLGLLWLGAALFCTVLTGTRGAMLAALAAPFLAIAVRVLTLPAGPGRVRAAGVGAASGLVFALGAALFIFASPAGKSMQQRIATGIKELSEQGDTPRGDMGARIWMGARAVSLWKTHPIRGVGAGGYRAAVTDDLTSRGIDPVATPIAVHHQAHSTPLHLLATGGIVSLLLCLGLVAAAGASAIRTMRARTDLSPLALAPALGLAALAVFGLAETLHINAHTASIACLLLAFCYPPPVQGPPPQTTPSKEPSAKGSREKNGSA